MAVKPLGARDHRIDILRGFALTSIFINHVPGNLLEPWTHKNFGFTDSAELFVLLAGIAAAFAYFPRFAAGERWSVTMKALKRAGLLYIAHLASTVVGLAIFSLAAVAWSRPELLEEINIGPFMADPARGLIGVASLLHQLGYHNILPLYVCLLLMLPAILVLARGGLGSLLGASIGLYALTQLFGWNLPNYPTDGGWAFDPFAWQLIFVVGFCVGMRILKGEVPVPYVRPLWWAGLGFLAFAGVYHHFNFYGSIPEIPFLPHNFQINEKPWVAAQRLTHILALAYVVGHSPIMRWLGRLTPANPLALLGRHALPVFWLGTALSMVGFVMMKVIAPEAPGQLGYLAAGFTLQLALAWALDASAKADRARRRARSASVPAARPVFGPLVPSLAGAEPVEPVA